MQFNDNSFWEARQFPLYLNTSLIYILGFYKKCNNLCDDTQLGDLSRDTSRAWKRPVESKSESKFVTLN